MSETANQPDDEAVPVADTVGAYDRHMHHMR
jgi:hypothetical protein